MPKNVIGFIPADGGRSLPYRVAQHETVVGELPNVDATAGQRVKKDAA